MHQSVTETNESIVAVPECVRGEFATASGQKTCAGYLNWRFKCAFRLDAIIGALAK